MMSTDPATALLIVFVVCVVLIIAVMVTKEASDPLGPLMDAADLGHKEFSAYVKRELAKAQAGAANADPWATELVDRYEQKHTGEHHGR
jgi:hypothetical protein